MIDPAWEYWVPDPEIAAVMGCDTPGGFDGIAAPERSARGSRRDLFPGFRLGRGDPDATGRFRLGRGDPDATGRFRLARAKPERPRLPDRRCKGCRTFFAPDRSSRLYCPGCYRPRGRVRTLPDSVPCAHCGEPFRQPKARQRHCSIACGNAAMTGRAVAKTRKIDPAELAALVAAGWRTPDLADYFGTYAGSVRKAARRYGLPVGKPGRPRKED